MITLSTTHRKDSGTPPIDSLSSTLSTVSIKDYDVTDCACLYPLCLLPFPLPPSCFYLSISVVMLGVAGRRRGREERERRQEQYLTVSGTLSRFL